MANWFAEFRDTAVSVLEQADQLAASNLRERERRRRRLGLDPHVPEHGSLSYVAQNTDASKSSLDDSITPKNSPELMLANGYLKKTEDAAKNEIDYSSMDASKFSTDNFTRLTKENQFLRDEIASLEDEISSYASRIKDVQEKLAEHQNQVARTERQLVDERQAKQQLAALVQELKSQIADLEATTQEQKARLNLLQQENESLMKSHVGNTDKHLQEIRMLQEQLKRFQAESGQDAAQLRRQLAEAQARNQEHHSIQENYRVHVDSLKQNLQASQDELKAMNGRATKFEQALDLLEQEYADYRQKAKGILVAKETIINQLREGKIDEEQSTSVQSIPPPLQHDLAEAREEIVFLQSKLQDVQEDHERHINEYEEEISRLNKHVEEIQRGSKTAEFDLTSRINELTQARDSAVSRQQHAEAELIHLQRQMETLRLCGQERAPKLNKQPGTQRSNDADILLKKQMEIDRLKEQNTQLTIELENESKLVISHVKQISNGIFRG
eukprot:gene4137-6495_t